MYSISQMRGSLVLCVGVNNEKPEDKGLVPCGEWVGWEPEDNGQGKNKGRSLWGFIFPY